MHLKKIELEPAIIWKVSTCQRIPSKNTRTQWLDTWARDAVRRYWSAKHYFDSCQLIKTWMYNIRLQAPKLASKCEIGMPVERTDGRSGGRCTVTWLPNFLGWIDFLSYWASNWARDQINYRRKTLNTTWPQWIENEPAIHSGDDGQRIL